ncbi:MAG: histidine kinase dimerization/phospho-acceptor domain-containing protein, partial [Candidatus Tectomicrobia bacterium]
MAENLHEKATYAEAASRDISQIMNNSPDFIFKIRIDNFQFTEVNQTACEYYGYSRDEFLAMKIFDIEIDDYVKEEIREIYDEIHEGTMREAYGINKKKNGETFPVHMRFLKLDDVFALANIRDITEQKREESALKEGKSAAEEAAHRKGEFLATMSHEIRTPMNGVLGITGLLLDTALSADQRQLAETIHRSGETLLGIINDILDFSKIEANALDMETLDFELRTTVEDVLELLAAKAHHKGLELGYVMHATVPLWGAGDPGRLRQILTNLVGNAVKFTDTGEVAVHVTLDAVTDQEALVRFAVTDTGIGIPPE